MKKLLLLLSLQLSTNAWAYNESDLIKLKTLNACEGCDLSGIHLSGADLRRANLSNANFTEADLRNANLSGANLNGANFSGAMLNGANLSSTDLTTSNLREVELGSAIFCRTKVLLEELNDGCR